MQQVGREVGMMVWSDFFIKMNNLYIRKKTMLRTRFPLLFFSYHLLLLAFLFQVGLAHAQLPDSLLQRLAAADTEEDRYEVQLEIGKSYSMSFDHAMADSLYEAALSWAKEADNPRIQIQALYGMAKSQSYQHKVEQAEAYYQESIDLAEAKNLPDLQISALSAYGSTLFRHRRPQEALAVLEAAVNLLPAAEVHPDTKSMLLYNLAGAYMMTGKMAEAKTYLNEVIQFWQETEQWSEYANGLNGLGVLCKNMGQLDSAKIYYEQSLLAYRTHGMNEPATLFTPIHNLSALALQAGELDRSFSLVKEALELAEEVENVAWQADVYRELGDTYLRFGDLEQSRTFLDKSVALLAPLDLPRSMGKTLSFYSKLLQEEENYEEAIEMLEKSNDLFGFSEANPIPYCSYLVSKSTLLKYVGQYEQAIELGHTGLSLARNNTFPLWEVNFLATLAENYLAMGRADSAKFYALESIRVADQNGYFLEKIPAYEVLQKALPQMNEYQAAFTYAREYQLLKDSTFQADLASQVSKERVRQNILAAEEKQAQAEKASALLSSRNQLFLGLLIALAVILLGGVFFFQQLRRNKREIETQNTTLAQLNLTKDKFFGIVSHDLRSPLMAFQGLGKQINHYVGRGNLDKLAQVASQVDETSDRLNGLLDNLLNWALLQTGTIPYRPVAVSLQEVLLDTFEIFEHNAEAKEIDLISQIDPALNVYADTHALYAIMRNLISNALKFTQPGGTVTVSTESKAGKIFISVNDTGTGISVENLEKIFSLDKESKRGTAGEKGTGLGLLLTKELIELNQGEMEIRSKLGIGSTVTLCLPAFPQAG